MLDKVDDEPIIWQQIIKKTGLPGFRSSIIVGALTAKRAFLFETKDNQKILLKQCYLAKNTVAVMNRRVISHFAPRAGVNMKHEDPRPRAYRHNHEEGDVLFFGKGQLLLRFDEVENPDGVVALFNSAIRQQVTSALNETVTSNQSPISVASSNQSPDERELWDSGPIIAPVQFEGSRWGARYIKIRYMLTTKRAYVIGAGGEGKIEKGSASFMGAAYGLGRPKLVYGKIIVPKDWKGGIISQCNLAEAEPAVVNRKQNANFRIKVEKSLADINFLMDGRIAVTFEGLEDADGVVSLIRQAFL